MITAEDARVLFGYDPETGALTRGGKAAGWINTTIGYRQVSITLEGKRKVFYAHRLAWLLHYGEWPAQEIDHINGDRVDNRICNLRDVPRRINCENQKHPGVTYFDHGKRIKRWKPQIVVNGKHVPLGYYATREEAEAVYLEAKRKLHGGCTI